MNLYGLIGYPLSHSFSKKYFTEKFAKEGINNARYELFEIEHISSFPEIISRQKKELKGLNVTIPHKQAVIPFLDDLDPAAKAINAVNVIKVAQDGRLIGYNSDYFGFKQSLLNLLPNDFSGLKALVLGTGGASKAVKAALADLDISFTEVSRTAARTIISYKSIDRELISDHKLIINTTPLGMSPKTDTCPDLPYESITSSHYLFDLVYNPETTLFMQHGITAEAKVSNGLEMLHLQAEKAWEIWTSDK